MSTDPRRIKWASKPHKIMMRLPHQASKLPGEPTQLARVNPGAAQPTVNS